MPTIVIGSTKGGCGKTTLALVLTSELSEAGADVAMLDADREGSLSNWHSDWEGGAPITIKAKVTEDSIMDDIAEASEKASFVIVDVEGTANVTMMKAATMADLVLIPQKASALDWERTAKTVKAISDANRMTKRDIPYRVVVTQTSQVARSKPMMEIISQLRGSAPTLNQELFDLEAYRSMFLYRKTLGQLAAAGEVRTSTAKFVARELVGEIVAILKGETA